MALQSACWLLDNEHNERLPQGSSSLSMVDSTIAIGIKDMPSERNAGAVSQANNHLCSSGDSSKLPGSINCFGYCFKLILVYMKPFIPSSSLNIS